MDSHKIHRSAVGRFAMLGDLYNAQRDEFLPINALKKQLEVEDSIQYEKNITKIDYIETNSVREEFKKFGIDKELSLSILCGLVNLGDPPAFLNSQMKSTRSQQMTLVYTLHTKTEELDEIRNNVNTDYLHRHDATHIVVSIDWGAACSITCRQDRDETADELQVKSRLKAQLEKLKLALSGECKSKLECCQQDEERLSYHTNFVIQGIRKDTRQSFNDAIFLAKSLLKITSKINGGRGIPIKFTLLPLNSLRKALKIDMTLDSITNEVDEETVAKCFQLMQEIREKKQNILYLTTYIMENEDILASDDINAALTIYVELCNEETTCKSELSRVLLDARSGHNHGTSMMDALKKFFQTFNSERISDKLTFLEGKKQKITLITELRKGSVLYIAKEGDLKTILNDNKDKVVYVFYMDYGEQSRRPDEWGKQEEMFLKLTKAYKDDNEVQLVAVDLEFQQQLTPERGIRIEYYDHGHIICKDLVREEGQNLNICIINVNVIDEVKQRPSKRMPFEVICPLSLKGKCPVDDCQWICKRCREVVDYGIKGEFLYCKCGKSNVFDATFRCSNAKHGLSFTAFEHDYLQTQLSSLDAVKETNILILGETGVGKSTWINAIANYVAFSSLQDAIDANDMKAFIPFRFDYTSETGEKLELSVGPVSCINDLDVDQHGTLRPEEYKFCTRSHIITFIDTPGIGSTRGTEQDKMNIESILNFITVYDQIHALCILLRPEQARITPSFKFCVIELLRYLHKSAAENILFCFTHTRSTFYGPGDTLSVLQSLLKECKRAVTNVPPERQFCFDNEAFRFLACHQNGIQFSKEEINSYSGSWDKSAIETQRLLDYIKKLNPYFLKSTICINKAKRTIMDLREPLAQSLDNIQSSIIYNKTKKAEVCLPRKEADAIQYTSWGAFENLVPPEATCQV